MKKIFSLFLLCSIFFMGCTSAKLISSTTIPSEKETVYISFDNTQATVSTGGFVVGNTFFAGTDTASFNTLENRMLTKTSLIEKQCSDAQIQKLICNELQKIRRDLLNGLLKVHN